MAFPEEAKQAVNHYEQICRLLEPATEEEADVDDCVGIFILAESQFFMEDKKAVYFAFALDRDIHAAGDLYRFAVENDDRISDRLANLLYIFGGGHTDTTFYANWLRRHMEIIMAA